MANLSLRQPVANTAPREGYARIHGLHHWAFRCRDADETRHFYEEILGLPLAAAVHQPRGREGQRAREHGKRRR